MSMITDMIARGWENFLARPEGPINLRFFIQPTLASIVAIRAGLKDAKLGNPPYLWTALTNREHRAALLHGGWKDMRMPVIIAATLDAIYQLIVHHMIYRDIHILGTIFASQQDAIAFELNLYPVYFSLNTLCDRGSLESRKVLGKLVDSFVCVVSQGISNHDSFAAYLNLHSDKPPPLIFGRNRAYSSR